MPDRIQLRRTKGWRKPPGAIVVARPTVWGNPFRAMPEAHATDAGARAAAVTAFRAWLLCKDWFDFTAELEPSRRAILDGLPELRGRDLACWCPLDQPCHADVLLAMANA